MRLGFDQARNRAVNPLQAVLTNQLHRLGKALIFPLHFRQEPDAVFQRACVHGQFHPAFRRGGGPAFPLLHPQAVARNDVGGGLSILLGVFQGTAGFPGGRLRFLPLDFQGGAAGLQAGFPGFQLAG